MNTTHPQVVKNVLSSLERGVLSRTEIAVQEGIVYNTVKNIEEKYKSSALQGLEICHTGYSKITEEIYPNRKPDNDGYFPIDYDEVLYLVDSF